MLARLREIVVFLTEIGQFALVLALLLIAREIWFIVRWTGTAQ